MTTVTPESFNKRSFVYRKLAGATFTDVADSALATDFYNGSSQAEKAGLVDLSVLARSGYRGLNAAQHLEAIGLPVPAKPNQASVSDNGELVLRLSQKEYWVLAALADQGAGVEQISLRGLPQSDCYSLYCQDSHAWFALTGAHLPEIMAKVCGVDLREDSFPLGSIAQTSAARINVIVVNHQVNGIPCFSILCDSAAAEYLWDSLLDAMQEFGGEAIGTAALLE